MIQQSCIQQIKDTANVIDIVGKYVKLKKEGKDTVGLCPFHNEKSPSFKVSPTKNIYKCFGCGESGDSIQFLMKFLSIQYLDAIKNIAEFYKIEIIEENNEPAKVYTKPVLKEGQISAKWLKYFDERGISGTVLSDLKITMVNEWMPKAKGVVETICFNYFRNEELVNVKYRADNKDFKLSENAELIFYNLNSIFEKETVIITEGEIDCLSVLQCVDKKKVGVISVPNGANSGNQKLEYLNNCYKSFDKAKNIILMTDNDKPGLMLRDELARRFGYDKCLKVEYPEKCKDANDVLVKFGKESLLKVIVEAVEFPIEGVFSMHEMYEDVKNYYKNGYPVGIKVGIPNFDDHIQFMLGQFTTITGIPGSGKSEFVDYIMTEAAKNNDWSFGVCSFENQPSSLHVTKIMEKYTGKSFEKRYHDSDRINSKEFEASVNFVNNHFYFININKVNVTLSGILEKTKELVLRRGIKGLLIDPWNYIEHKNTKGVSETQYISDCLTEIKAFSQTYGIHIFIVAHPSKMPKVGGKYEVPTLYSISGSAHFFNKTDNGICVNRDYQNGIVDVYIQKVRFSWLGRIGVCSFEYDLVRRNYKPITRAKDPIPEQQKVEQGSFPLNNENGYDPKNWVDNDK